MYIRIQKNTIRYRISREEADSLLAGDILSEEVNLSSSQSLKYTLKASRQSNFYFHNSTQTLAADIDDSLLTTEINSGPTKTGILINTNNKESGPEQVTLEIDLKKKR